MRQGFIIIAISCIYFTSCRSISTTTKIKSNFKNDSQKTLMLMPPPSWIPNCDGKLDVYDIETRCSNVLAMAFGTEKDIYSEASKADDEKLKTLTNKYGREIRKIQEKYWDERSILTLKYMVDMAGAASDFIDKYNIYRDKRIKQKRTDSEDGREALKAPNKENED